MWTVLWLRQRSWSARWCSVAFLSLILRNSPQSSKNPTLLSESKLCRLGALGTREKCWTWRCCCQRAGVPCLAGNETRIFFICSRHQMVFQAFDIFWGIKEPSVIRHGHINMKWNTLNSVLQIPWYQQQAYKLLLVYRKLQKENRTQSILSYYPGAFQLQWGRGLHKKCTYFIFHFLPTQIKMFWSLRRYR